MSESGTIFSARVAVQCENDVLILKRHESSNNLKGFWEFPGGGIQPGELPYDAGCREVFEETGQTIDMLTFAALALEERKIGNGTNVNRTMKTYGLMGTLASKIIVPSLEHSDHAWVDPRTLQYRSDVTIDTKLVAEGLGYLLGIRK